jgi:hypothetical protein
LGSGALGKATSGMVGGFDIMLLVVVVMEPALLELILLLKEWRLLWSIDAIVDEGLLLFFLLNRPMIRRGVLHVAESADAGRWAIRSFELSQQLKNSKTQEQRTV